MLYYKNFAQESTNFSGQGEMSENSWFYLIENRFCHTKINLRQEQNQNKANGLTPIETPWRIFNKVTKKVSFKWRGLWILWSFEIGWVISQNNYHKDQAEFSCQICLKSPTWRPTRPCLDHYYSRGGVTVAWKRGCCYLPLTASSFQLGEVGRSAHTIF